MPLVVPGLMTTSNTNPHQESWTNKLIGKKITDGASDEIVCISTAYVNHNIDGRVQSFAKKDLPKESRVIEHGSMTTQDHNPDRLVFLWRFGRALTRRIG